MVLCISQLALAIELLNVYFFHKPDIALYAVIDEDSFANERLLIECGFCAVDYCMCNARCNSNFCIWTCFCFVILRAFFLRACCLVYALSRTEDIELEFSAALEVDDEFSTQMHDSLGIRDVIPGERATSSVQDSAHESAADLHNMGAKRPKGTKSKAPSKSQEPMEATVAWFTVTFDLNKCCAHGYIYCIHAWLFTRFCAFCFTFCGVWIWWLLPCSSSERHWLSVLWACFILFLFLSFSPALAVSLASCFFFVQLHAAASLGGLCFEFADRSVGHHCILHLSAL